MPPRLTASLLASLGVLTLASPAGAEGKGFVVRELTIGGALHRYAVWTPPDYDAARAWPCLVFLHGSGEWGDDGEKPTRIGLGPQLAAHPERWPFVVVFPQKPTEEEEWEEREDVVLAALDSVRRDYAVDSTRIALTGMSQGGHGTWYLGARHARRWSCLVPVCAYGRARSVAPRVAALPVWAFHGLRDDLVNPEDTRLIVGEIRARRARLGHPPSDSLVVRMTLYPEANHNAWDPAYSEPELPRWILAQRRER